MTIIKSANNLTTNIQLKNMNIVMFEGTLVREPKVSKIGEKGTSFVSFSLGQTHTIKQPKKGKVIEIDSYQMGRAYGHTADYIGKYAKKGDRISIGGTLSSSSFKDKDGNTRYINYITVTSAKIHMPTQNPASDAAPKNVEELLESHAEVANATLETEALIDELGDQDIE